MRYQLRVAFSEASGVLPQVMEEFAALFGRSHFMLETYCCEDAEAVVVTMGSMSVSRVRS